jgi:diguanylate cyclase (GGDEF)-like protein
LYNNTAFYQRLNEEIDRIEEIEASQLTLCLFRVDKYASLDPQIYSDRLEMAVSNAIDIAKKYTKKYEIMGRIDSDTYAIIFINHNNNDIKLIAERFRNDVANSIIEFDNTKFSVTISIGLASYQKRIGVNGLVSNAINALTKSLQFTNHVQLYK